MSVHQSQAPRDDFDLISFSSASAYFESRPPRRFVSGSPEIYRIAITASMGPQDLPYPTHFGTFDTTAQDVRIAGFLKYFSSFPPPPKNNSSNVPSTTHKGAYCTNFTLKKL
jgi:hypothetical protein